MEMILLSGIGPSETNPEFNEIYFDLSFNPVIEGSQNQFDEDNDDNFLADTVINNFGQGHRTSFEMDSPEFC